MKRQEFIQTSIVTLLLLIVCNPIFGNDDPPISPVKALSLSLCSVSQVSNIITLSFL
jgi:hypothetical protein